MTEPSTFMSFQSLTTGRILLMKLTEQSGVDEFWTPFRKNLGCLGQSKDTKAVVP